MREMMYGYDFRWQQHRVAACWFDDEAEMVASFQRALDNIGYYPPRWWEFWRWDEALPRPYWYRPD